MFRCAGTNTCKKEAITRLYFLGCGKSCAGHLFCKDHKKAREGSLIVHESAPNVVERLGSVVGRT